MSNLNLNNLHGIEDEIQGGASPSIKRLRSEISPEKNSVKVGELSVEDLRSIFRDENKEVLDKLNYLTDDFNDLKKQNEMLKQEIQNIQAEKDSDRKRIAQLEDQFKRKNLIFKGLPSSKSTVNEVKKVCNEILKIPDTSILKSAKKLTERNGKITVLAELDSEQSTYVVLNNTKELKGTNIYIERDLNVDRQKDKRAMLRLKKEIVKVSKIHRVIVRDDRLRIADKWFKWSQHKQLLCGQSEAEPIMKQLYGDQALGINLQYEYLVNENISKN